MLELSLLSYKETEMSVNFDSQTEKKLSEFTLTSNTKVPELNEILYKTTSKSKDFIIIIYENLLWSPCRSFHSI